MKEKQLVLPCLLLLGFLWMCPINIVPVQKDAEQAVANNRTRTHRLYENQEIVLPQRERTFQMTEAFPEGAELNKPLFVTRPH